MATQAPQVATLITEISDLIGRAFYFSNRGELIEATKKLTQLAEILSLPVPAVIKNEAQAPQKPKPPITELLRQAHRF